MRRLLGAMAISMAATLTCEPAVSGDGLPSLTQAQLIGAFDDACLATSADPVTASAKAREHGFGDSQGAEEKVFSSVFANLKTSIRLTLGTGSGAVLFQVGRGPTLAHTRYPTMVCAIAAAHAGDVDLRTAYRAHFGAEPDVKEVAYDLYSFAWTGGGHTDVRVDSGADVSKAIQAGTYRTVIVGPHQAPGAKFDVLMLLIPVDEARKADTATPEPSH